MSFSWDLLDAVPPRRLPRDMEVHTPAWSRGTPLSASRSLGSPMHKSPDNVHLLPADDLSALGSNEKQQMQGLNDRFAGFIDKVRQLEQLNRGLETEIAALRDRQSRQSGLAANYEPEVSELRNLLVEAEKQKVQLELESEQVRESTQRLAERYEVEARARMDAQTSGQACHTERDISNAATMELQLKAQSLMDEIMFLKSNHEEEVAELYGHIQAAQVNMESRDVAKADLAGALRSIRAQIQGCSGDSLGQAEQWFDTRVAKLNQAAAVNSDALQTARQQLSEYSRQIQSRDIELQTMRARKESLEKQMGDAEARHHSDLLGYQDAIQQQDNELQNTKREMVLHLRQYQQLLDVKMALDVEIASYRKLLEGEETRFGDYTPSTYTYKPQPLTHATYMTTKTKATSTKLMPQYRFVEEIISATTKEVNMAELEADYKVVMDQEGETQGEAAERQGDADKEPSEAEQAAEEGEDKGEEAKGDVEEENDEKEVAEGKDGEKVEKGEEQEEVKEVEAVKEEEEAVKEEEEAVKEEEEAVKEEEEAVKEEEEAVKEEEEAVKEEEEVKEEEVKEAEVEEEAEVKEEKLKEEQTVEEKDEEKAKGKVEEKAVKEKVKEKTEDVKAEIKDGQKVEEMTDVKAEAQKVEGKAEVKDKEKIEKAEEKKEEKAEVKVEEKRSEQKTEGKGPSQTKEGEGVMGAVAVKGGDQVEDKLKDKDEVAKVPDTKAAGGESQLA